MIWNSIKLLPPCHKLLTFCLYTLQQVIHGLILLQIWIWHTAIFVIKIDHHFAIFKTILNYHEHLLRTSDDHKRGCNVYNPWWIRWALWWCKLFIEKSRTKSQVDPHYKNVSAFKKYFHITTHALSPDDCCHFPNARSVTALLTP